MAEPFDVAEALEALAAKRPRYERYARYYQGEHDIRFASDAYRATFGRLLRSLRYNRCATVVDAIADRLQIKGWQDATKSDDEADAREAMASWQDIQGDMLQGLVHVEALRSGDAYVIVWPDPADERRARWTLNRGDSCYVMTDDETHEPVVAVKVWQVRHGADAGRWRLTIYDDRQITRWITSKRHEQQPAKPGTFEPYDADGEAIGRNPYGVIPVIHFPNNPQFQGECGISELEDIIPLQDGLNYSIWQLMIASEFTSWPMRWATGVEPTLDPLTGQVIDTLQPAIDRFIKVSSEVAQIGQLPGSDMAPFVEVQDAWDRKICRVSRVPAHGMGLAGASDNISGESRKVLESGFVAKLRDRQLAFGDGWERAMQLDLTIRGYGDAAGQIVPVWQSPEPRSDLEALQQAQLQQNLGIPQEQIWRELGYTTEQIAEFRAINQRVADEQAARFAAQFVRGQADGFVDDEAQA